MSISSNVRTSMENQSWVRRMFELGLEMKKLHGEDNVFDLSLGNPILEPPQSFVEELQRLASDPTKGMHRYMPNAGYPETRGPHCLSNVPPIVVMGVGNSWLPTSPRNPRKPMGLLRIQRCM